MRVPICIEMGLWNKFLKCKISILSLDKAAPGHFTMDEVLSVVQKDNLSLSLSAPPGSVKMVSDKNSIHFSSPL